MNSEIKPMVLSTYGGEAENLKTCNELGFTLFQTDTDHLSTNEIEEGRWDWTVFDECMERAVSRLHYGSKS